MSGSANKPDPEEMLFTLDQLEQTTEIMGRVVSRLKRQLQQLQQAAPAEPAPLNRTEHTSPPAAKARRTLH
ncbi:hypothetical protein [Gilvimarinus algae]|uniref:Uncharacterized protein n=1 Tax=Gilvimarinus algae TaxID=3058037 RepID=A0ABT8TI62_9GAMM|nr:hypothetical protein [Gilvimarinus sp. SDUM040014]MDO3382002.1 hypothetical protein [Gilvimarinus sp. SDUM040014]